MKKNHKLTGEEMLDIASESGVDISGIDANQLAMGYNVELEHGTVNADTNVTDDDVVATIKIAIAHLRETSDYYTLLKKYVEKEQINENNMLNESMRMRQLAGLLTAEEKLSMLSEEFKDNTKDSIKLNENFDITFDNINENESVDDMGSDSESWEGVDRDLETSLEEYNFVATPYTKDGHSDEYWVIYKIRNDAYGSGFIREEELNKLINGEEWASEEDVNSFLSFVGQTKEEWLSNRFVSKLSDIISYWSHENIMGTDYSPSDKKWAFSKIGIASDDEDEDNLDEDLYEIDLSEETLNEGGGAGIEFKMNDARFRCELKITNGHVEVKSKNLELADTFDALGYDDGMRDVKSDNMFIIDYSNFSTLTFDKIKNEEISGLRVNNIDIFKEIAESEGVEIDDETLENIKTFGDLFEVLPGSELTLEMFLSIDYRDMKFAGWSRGSIEKGGLIMKPYDVNEGDTILNGYTIVDVYNLENLPTLNADDKMVEFYQDVFKSTPGEDEDYDSHRDMLDDIYK